MSQTPMGNKKPVDVSKDVQGDVIIGFPKKKQDFVFFVIKNAANFKQALPRLRVASTADVMAAREKIEAARKETPGVLAPVGLLNIAFSKKGLDALGAKDNIGDAPFTAGQRAGAKDLGDDGVTGPQGFEPNWEAAFKSPIDGILVIAGESWKSVKELRDHATNIFGESMRVVYNLKGTARPGDEKGHEHFGWEDGISNPAVKGVGMDGKGTILPGQLPVRPGIIVCGMEGDPVPNRPGWAVGGSFLVFRQLSQLVPEFHQYLALTAAKLGLAGQEGADLLGARLVGRWKSGAPIVLTKNLKDDPELGKDKQRNNVFDFSQEEGDAGQELCPYAAHIRKTNPRSDLAKFRGAVEEASIIRAGIPYGPEMTFDEKAENVTEFERGLAFVCYQSSIQKGFKFMQESWANKVNFPPGKGFNAGFDPLIGQANGKDRDTWGQADGFKVKAMPEFVNSRGGEYFFSPSITALQNGFASR